MGRGMGRGLGGEGGGGGEGGDGRGLGEGEGRGQGRETSARSAWASSLRSQAWAHLQVCPSTTKGSVLL